MTSPIDHDKLRAVAEAANEAAERLRLCAGNAERDGKLVTMTGPTADEIATTLTTLAAENAALREVGAEIVVALHGFVLAGCPVCSGDCASANPPVLNCPMAEANRVVRNWNRAALETNRG